jgi:hypothetical protein
MKSKAPIFVVLVIAVAALFLLWPKDDAPLEAPGRKSRAVKKAKQGVKLTKAKPVALSKALIKKGEKKPSKGPEKKPQSDFKDLAKKLRDAVADGSMSKKDAMSAWRKEAGKGHPWQYTKGKKGKGKGGRNTWKKEAAQSWARERALYWESRRLTVRGRLVDEIEQPIGDAKVALLPLTQLSKSPNPQMGSPTEGKTTEEGRFELSAEGHQFRLRIESDEGVENRNILVPWSESKDIDLGDIVLHRAYQVSGVVRDPEGQAVAGARVRVFTAENYQRLVAAENVAYVAGNFPSMAETSSSETGSWDFELAGGTYVIAAWKDGFCPSPPRTLTNLDGPLSDQLLALTPLKTLTVTVKDQSGLGLSDVAVALTRFGLLYRGSGQALALVTTNGDGQAIFEALPMRRYQIVADAEGYARVLERVQFADTDSSRSMTLTIYTGAEVTGRLISKQGGEAVQGTLVCSGALASGAPDMQRLLNKSAVDEEGRFSYQRVSPGRYILAIHPPGHAPKDVSFEIAVDQAVVELGDIELVALGEVTLTVLRGDEQAASGHRVQVWYHESSHRNHEGSTNEAGELSLEGLALGPSTVTILDKSGQVLGFDDLDFSTESSPTIRLPGATATLKGRLLSAAGAPLAGTLELIRAGGRVSAIVVTVPKTGAIDHPDLPPGSYDVYLPADSTVARPGFSGQQLGTKLATIKLLGDETAEQDFTVPDAATTPAPEGSSSGGD